MMWCDDFDCDLPKVVPGAREAIGDAAGIQLCTHGKTTHGRLNHPDVWNSYEGMVAFFGFRTPAKPPSYVTVAPIVRCTFWEAVRDWWGHDFRMLVEGEEILPYGNWRWLEPIMWSTRGWGDPERKKIEADAARERTIKLLVKASRALLRRAPIGAL